MTESRKVDIHIKFTPSASFDLEIFKNRLALLLQTISHFIFSGSSADVVRLEVQTHKVVEMDSSTLDYYNTNIGWHKGGRDG